MFFSINMLQYKKGGGGGERNNIYYQNGKRSKERACLEDLYYENSIHVPKNGWILEYLGQCSQFLV